MYPPTHHPISPGPNQLRPLQDQPPHITGPKPTPTLTRHVSPYLPPHITRPEPTPASLHNTTPQTITRTADQHTDLIRLVRRHTNITQHSILPVATVFVLYVTRDQVQERGYANLSEWRSRKVLLLQGLGSKTSDEFPCELEAVEEIPDLDCSPAFL
ncbi:hypothetical protein MJO28_010430 [Puccinia striiformis f. sp. tritici]|uniref:Uncharacterized protein n=1 Tax=Puccinia striiformis f. sp. tritici TaxID=168172 RepID=A0ACC0E4Z2_9BASI|nr:hypothetical protein MJO28_010430 [Puccinia striiformis f. sp. tritici]